MSLESTRTDTRAWPTRWTPPSLSWPDTRHPLLPHIHTHTNNTRTHTQLAATDTHTLYKKTNTFVHVM